MGNRLDLHDELLLITDNVYFQPPSDKIMQYPCIVYHKSANQFEYADNVKYKNHQEYQLTVIDKNPDSDIPDKVISSFPYSSITSYFVSDNLNHTTIKLYY